MTIEPKFTTRECAEVLGVTPAFIRGEILDGRLEAITIQRHATMIYRVTLSAFRTYCEKYAPRALAHLPHAS